MDDQAIQLAEKIDRYLLGKMSEDEYKSFEYQLAQNASLRQEVENTEIAKEAVRFHALKSEVKSVRGKMLEERSQAAKEIVYESSSSLEETKVRKLSPFQYSYRIAAGLVILLVAFVAVQTATVSPEGVYESHISLNGVGEVTRGGRETASQSTLLDAYQQQDFTSVTSTYESLSHPSSLESYFAAASYLQLNETEEAIVVYKQIIASSIQQGNNEFLMQESSYNLALSYIRAGEYDLAMPILKNLNDNYPYYEQMISSSLMWKLRLLQLKDRLFN